MSTTVTRPDESEVTAPAKSGRTSAGIRRALPAAAILIAIGLIWEAVSHWFGVPNYVLPSLDSIWSTGVSSWSGTLASATWVTTEEVVLGFLLSIVIALVIAPVLAIIFGYTITPKLIVVTLICFFPIVVNTIDGLASVDPELLRVMRTLDGNRWATLRRVEAPAALPSIFSGLRIAATYAPIGAVFGEYAGSQNGLGYVMIQAIPQLETALVFAAIFILTAEAILLFIAVSVLERIICPWAREGKR